MKKLKCWMIAIGVFAFIGTAAIGAEIVSSVDSQFNDFVASLRGSTQNEALMAATGEDIVEFIKKIMGSYQKVKNILDDLKSKATSDQKTAVTALYGDVSELIKLVGVLSPEKQKFLADMYVTTSGHIHDLIQTNLEHPQQVALAEIGKKIVAWANSTNSDEQKKLEGEIFINFFDFLMSYPNQRHVLLVVVEDAANLIEFGKNNFTPDQQKQLMAHLSNSGKLVVDLVPGVMSDPALCGDLRQLCDIAKEWVDLFLKLSPDNQKTIIDILKVLASDILK